MAKNIERYKPPQRALATTQGRALQPSQGRALSVPSHGRRALTAYEKPLAPLTPALRFATQLKEHSREVDVWFSHEVAMVSFARDKRNKFIDMFGRADEARSILSNAGQMYAGRPSRKMASAMIGAMLGAFGAKADKDVLAGMLDMMENDELGCVSELWLPLNLTPASLALACRKLIATKERFAPTPAELAAACREAGNTLGWAKQACDELVDFVRRCDILLLEFDHDEWERPYLTPQYRPILERMLQLHDIYGPGHNGAEDWGEDDDGNYPNPLYRLLVAEQAKLALPAPDAPEAKLVPEQPAPERAKQIAADEWKQIADESGTKLAACKTTAPAKRTRKPIQS